MQRNLQVSAVNSFFFMGQIMKLCRSSTDQVFCLVKCTRLFHPFSLLKSRLYRHAQITVVYYVPSVVLPKPPVSMHFPCILLVKTPCFSIFGWKSKSIHHASGTKSYPVPVAQSAKEKEAIAALACGNGPVGLVTGLSRVGMKGDKTMATLRSTSSLLLKPWPKIVRWFTNSKWW